MKPIFKMRINNKIPENFKHDLTKKTFEKNINKKEKEREKEQSLLLQLRRGSGAELMVATLIQCLRLEFDSPGPQAAV